MNIKHPFLSGVVGVFLAGILPGTGVAFAQNLAGQVAESAATTLPGTMSNVPACRPAGEAIVNLRDPRFGIPVVWDAVFGDQRGPVQFSGAVALEHKTLLVAGDALDTGYKPVEQVLVELNSRARAVDEKRYPAKTAERTQAILPLAGGYVVSSTMRGGLKDRATDSWTRLAWFDAERKFLRELILKDSALDYEAMNLSASADGKGFVAVVRATNRKNPKEHHAVLFRISDQGKILWKRSYNPGPPNYIYGVSIADGENYIAGGQIRHEDGRMAGWLMKLNGDGTIVWQNTYPRGQFAVFRSGTTKPAPHEADRYVVTGQIVPYGSDPAAAWVLEVDSNGKMIWQRYFRSEAFDVDGRDVMTHPDGRISLLANAKPNEGAIAAAKARADAAKTPAELEAAAAAPKQDATPVPDHVRLVTMSPRGIIMNDEAYLEGHGAGAQQLIRGWNGERIVIASIDMHKKPGADKGVELITDALARKEKEAEMAKAETLGPPTPTPEQMAVIAQGQDRQTRREGWVFVATGLDPYDDPCIISAAEPAQ